MRRAHHVLRTLLPFVLVPALLLATGIPRRIVRRRAERRLWDARVGGPAFESARTLADMGPGSLGPLLDALANGRPHTRAAAAWALSLMGPEAEVAVPLLLECLGSDEVAVQVEALNALDGLWEGDTEQRLAAAARVQDAPHVVRNRAARVLGVPVRTGPQVGPPSGSRTQDVTPCPNCGWQGEPGGPTRP